MSEYYVVIFNFKTRSSIPIAKIKGVLEGLKDWLRFSPEAWIVYTALSPAELRARLKGAVAEEDPSILVIKADLSEWAAYATTVPRDWLKRNRDDDGPGE